MADSWFDTLQRRIRSHESKTSRFWSFMRLLYLRLIVPIRRYRNEPVPVARGVFWGLLLGMTPTVGIQMYLIFVVWWITRTLFNYNFNLIIAIAWSWLSNPLTMVPLYYMFYMTGIPIAEGMGWADNVPSLLEFDSFSVYFQAMLEIQGDTWWQQTGNFLAEFWRSLGLMILVGCLPYSLGLSWLGYSMTMKMGATRKARALAQSQPKV
ncbi:MAG: DUF2062 domain-containing protein [Magnetococcales bacterium]|nr:DUF2062 domain-containing protein [Magnetococcales bacterium]